MLVSPLRQHRANVCITDKALRESHSSRTVMNAGTELLPGNLVCTPCPTATFSLAGKACDACASGSHPTTDKTGCVPCDAGKYSNALVIGDASQCAACPGGTYSTVPGLDDIAKCVKCSPGTKGTGEGQSSPSACVDCGVGEYTNKPGQLSCTTCDAGKATNGTGQTFCSRCPSGTFLDAMLQKCARCPVGEFAEAGSSSCQPCARGSYVKADQSGCASCVAGKYGSKRGALSSADGCVDCPGGTYSVAPGIDALIKCNTCPLGEFSKSTGSSSNTCAPCPAGRYTDSYGSSSCKECAEEGTFCDEGATKVTACDLSTWCNGTHRIGKPTVITVPTLTDAGLEMPTLVVSWPGKGEQGFKAGDDGTDPVLRVRVQLSVTKEIQGWSELAQNLSRTSTVKASDGSATFSDLRFEATYYARLFAISERGIESNAGDWSDVIRFDCPKGGYCLGDSSESEEYGISYSEVKPSNGFFRVDWAANASNLTFAACPVPENCLGGQGLNESCVHGTRGPLCEMCAPGFSKAGSSRCRRCSSEVVQVVYAVFGVLAGVGGLGVLIVLTLRNRGEASSLGVGIFKSGLRYFQLASLAASFPLEWPSFLSDLFGVMNLASSAAGDVLSVECSVGTNFLTNARITFLLPVALGIGLAAMWILEKAIQGKSPLKASVGKRIRLSLLVTLITLHPTLTKLVFRFFHCGKVISGRSLLRADASIVCWSPPHVEAVWNTAVPAIVAYVVGIPLSLFYLLVSNRDTLSAPDTKKYLGFAYANYRPGMYFWEVLVIARLVLFALLSVMYKEDVAFQAVLGLAVLFASALLHVVFVPFSSEDLHTLEAISLVANWATLFCGTLLFNPRVSSVVKAFITACVVCIQIGYVALSAYLFLVGDDPASDKEGGGVQGEGGGDVCIELTETRRRQQVGGRQESEGEVEMLTNQLVIAPASSRAVFHSVVKKEKKTRKKTKVKKSKGAKRWRRRDESREEVNSKDTLEETEAGSILSSEWSRLASLRPGLAVLSFGSGIHSLTPSTRAFM